MLNIALTVFILYGIKNIFHCERYIHISICLLLFSTSCFAMGWLHFGGVFGGALFFVASYVFIIFCTSLTYLVNIFSYIFFTMANFYAVVIIFNKQTNLLNNYILNKYIIESPYVATIMLVSFAYCFLHIKVYNNEFLGKCNVADSN